MIVEVGLCATPIMSAVPGQAPALARLLDYDRAKKRADMVGRTLRRYKVSEEHAEWSVSNVLGSNVFDQLDAVPLRVKDLLGLRLGSAATAAGPGPPPVDQLSPGRLAEQRRQK